MSATTDTEPRPPRPACPAFEKIEAAAQDRDSGFLSQGTWVSAGASFGLAIGVLSSYMVLDSRFDEIERNLVKIETAVEASRRDQFTEIDMARWAARLKQLNPNIEVPEVGE